MLIKDAARVTGFSKDTIRYYEKIGLMELGKVKRDRANYRRYGPTEVERLLRIKALKEFGFTLREIKYLLGFSDAGSVKCETIGEFVDDKTARIDKKIKHLKSMRQRLTIARSSCDGECAQSVEP